MANLLSWFTKKKKPENKVFPDLDREIFVNGRSKSGLKKPVDLPNSRSSAPPLDDLNKVLTNLKGTTDFMDTDFNRDIIPVIRKLCKSNPDLSQALQNIVNLGNTGHTIEFDKSVPDDQVKKMRNHIENKHSQWMTGQAGADGLVNRMISQLMIGGALSNEWVPNIDLTTIEAVTMVKPEDIYFKLNKRKTGYDPYQKINPGQVKDFKDNFKKLNTATYKYYALNGDGEVPYGFPPYMAALDPVCTQQNMNASINYVVNQLGLLGYLEVLITAPDQTEDQTDDAYATALQGMLMSSKERVTQGFKDGVVVGIKDEHEFKFNSIGRDFAKVVELYKQNELQVASAVKQDATLWGRDYNSSESQISIIFMKMISEFKNMHNILKVNLQFGYSLELRLAGFNFDYLNVKFNKATLQDELKFEQAMEIKLRNLKELYLMGTISTYQYANAAGYEEVDQDKPRVSDDILAGINPSNANEAAGAQKREKSKDASDKKVRDKNKPNGSKKVS